MRIKILYEDKNFLVIDKPSGISVHPDGKSKDKTISDWFVKKYPKSKNVGEPILIEAKEIKKPGIVHRLDKDTSGVLLLVKNQKSYEYFKKLFKDREIKKTYNTIVSGNFKNNSGTVNKPIGRSPSDFRKRLAGRGVRGKQREAITLYRVIKNFNFIVDKKSKKFLPFSFLEVFPKTGRTHQIRVHMKFINHPVVGDSLYNQKGENPIAIKRLALHAKSLEFKDSKGKTIKVESKLPKELEKVVK